LFGQVEKLLANLAALGARRLAALALIFVTVAALTAFAGYYLSRPNSEVLYSGLDREDVVSIGAALKEAGLAFDVNAEGTAVLVPVGLAAQARMILAVKGLPHSGSVGNELYDKLGSLGLTSFMQEVTRVRAIEGELARTIQMMQGVKAARVHIVMSDAGSFRREPQEPSASVIIRTDGGDDRATGLAIRHLVAAAIPNMKLDEVTVLNVDGRLLASGPDSLDKSPDNMLALEKDVSADIRDKVTATLAPYLSLRNFEVSVAARLNADKKQTAETTFDPDSRTERSVKVTKEQQASQNSAASPATSVTTNLPARTPAPDSKNSSDNNTKREEVTNYEISSKSVTTTSVGYTIEGLQVAVLINRAPFAATLGANPPSDALDKQVKELEQLVASAAGLRKDRGDVVKISVVDFADAAKDLEPEPSSGVTDVLWRQSGSLINAIVVILVAFLVVWFGMRPAIRALATTETIAGPPMLEAADSAPAEQISLPTNDPQSGSMSMLIDAPEEADEFLEALIASKGKSPQKHLENLVNYDEEHAAAILRRWVRQGA
jgi:flagellar M-ring protein FliF